ncbi:hypothetical protein RhiJN_22451 [Ceratobasidium sp. AG-Ba]|nr:hypothetical protein RhiJN_22451 [Ceratobasidium sp. AG-Ba]
MSQAFFPSRHLAIPSTKAERMEPKPKGKQPPDGKANAQTEDPEDLPGEEMSKGSRIWRTYVKETDRWDKEMVDGRNNSLDVLLIFVRAALFSAISTAFIIESLGDLKPDPAESSARTLLAISQKLDAISNGQSPTSFQIPDSDMDTFTPPYSAVLVNILWILSLSLSVAVSLVAMLAKEWCYKFMSGRFGELYGQARRRHLKWNGIEMWKMQEVLGYLPGLMHIALLLFAVGLCIYLWGISVSVAIPVTVVTALVACVYALTTVLPYFDQFCPYGTPATLVLGQILRHSRNVIKSVVYSVVSSAYNRVDDPKWLESALGRLADWIEHNSDDGQHKDDPDVPMDDITSQMIAWIIVNCEDSLSVSTALQAISGALEELPHASLVQCGALELAEARLRSLIQWDDYARRYRLKDGNTLMTALRYCRTYSILVSGGAYKSDITSWTALPNEILTPVYALSLQMYEVTLIQTNLLEYAEKTSVDHSVLAAAARGCLLCCSWNWEIFYKEFKLDKISFEMAIAKAGHEVSQHIVQNGSYLSMQLLSGLLESCIYYMIGYWPREKERLKSPLPALVMTYLQAHNTSPYVTRKVAIILAATSFTVNSYPGGKQPSYSTEDLLMRGVQALHYYHKTQKDRFDIDYIFKFGLVGLLPYMDLSGLESQTSLTSKLYDIVLDLARNRYPDTDVLPASYTWNVHLLASRQYCQPPIAEHPQIPGINSESILLYSLFLQVGLRHFELYVPALVMLRFAQSKELQSVCIKALSSIPIGRSRSEIDALFRSKKMLRALFSASHTTEEYITSIIVLNFRLLIATTMLCRDYELSKRQDILKDLISYHEEFQSLKPTKQGGTLPSPEQILAHTSEIVTNQAEFDCMLNSVQLIVDFCHASSDISMQLEPTHPESEDLPEWFVKLQEIKDNFCSGHFEVGALKSSNNTTHESSVTNDGTKDDGGCLDPTPE